MTNIYPKMHSFLNRKFLLILLLCTLVGSIRSHAQVAPSDFVITINTLAGGPSGATISLYSIGNYNVYYESIPAGVSGTMGPYSGTASVNLPAEGTYRLAIKPTVQNSFHRVSFHTNADAPKLSTIEQWGTTAWSTMANTFNGCVNLASISATDAPVLSNVTDMRNLFAGCSSLASVPNINNWDVSNVVDISGMFYNASSFNESLSNWDVSNVTDMNFMFGGAIAFNQPLNDWDVGNVTNMSYMFVATPAFNQPLANWDVSSVTNMSGMFYNTSSFNQPLNTWDVSNTTNMNSMFVGTPFNQPLGNWNVSNVRNTGYMFYNAAAFNQPLGNWNVSKVTIFAYMFYGATAFNQPLSNWNVSNATTLSNMFDGATAFNQNLGGWTLNPLVSIADMLNATGMNCGSYGNTLIGWAANGATPAGLSLGATGRTYGPGASAARDILINTNGWTITGDVLDAACGISATDYVTTWKTNNAGPDLNNQIRLQALGNYTLYYESIPAGIAGTLPATGTFTDNQVITFPVAGTYRVAVKPAGPVPFHQINFTPIGSQKLLTIEQWGTTAWSSMNGAYRECINLTTLPETDVPVLTNVTGMNYTFANCSSLIGSAKMNTWDVGSVTVMSNTFAGATAFNQPIGDWDVSNVTYMGSMFYGATAFNQPLNNWDVGNVTSTNNMFSLAASFNQPLDGWDVGNVTDMQHMFSQAPSFNQPLDSWDVSKVTAMTSMFRIASSFNQPLHNWNVGNVMSMAFMFDGTTSFNQSLGDWTLNATVSLGNMLNGSGMDCNNYSSTLIGWAGNAATPSGRGLGATGKTFGPAASSFRDYLLNTKSWTITGDSFDALCIVLPVTLASFDAVKQESTSLLTWSTTEETNSDRFEVQRSIDAKNWDKIGTLVSGGESKVLRKYQFQDQTPVGGLNYYRLKMVDRDETFAYSRIRSVEFSEKPGLSVYPNPASDRLLIGDYGQVKHLTLYNAAGVKLFQNKKITAQGIDVSKILPGVYAVEMTLTDGSIRASKVLISR